MKNQRVLEYDKGEKINKSTGSRHYWKNRIKNSNNFSDYLKTISVKG